MEPAASVSNPYQQIAAQYEADVKAENSKVLQKCQEFNAEARMRRIAMAIFATLAVIAAAGALAVGFYMSWSALTLGIVVGAGIVGLVATACLIYHLVLYCIMKPYSDNLAAYKVSFIQKVLLADHCKMSEEKWKVLAEHCTSITSIRFLYEAAQHIALPLREIFAILKKVRKEVLTGVNELEQHYEAYLDKQMPIQTLFTICEESANGGNQGDPKEDAACWSRAVGPYISKAVNERRVDPLSVTYRDIDAMLRGLPKLEAFTISILEFPPSHYPTIGQTVYPLQNRGESHNSWGYLICCHLVQRASEQLNRSMKFSHALAEFSAIEPVLTVMAGPRPDHVLEQIRKEDAWITEQLGM
jgi:hypothetical protein